LSAAEAGVPGGACSMISKIVAIAVRLASWPP
jgi:hypothetical protein